MKKLVLFLICLFAYPAAFATIQDYQQTFIPSYGENNELLIAIRTYLNQDERYYLVVNPNTFETRLLNATAFKARKDASENGNTSGYIAWSELENTPYIRALNEFTSFPYPLENKGITHAEFKTTGMFLTADLCPASKPFEKGFFEKLAALADQKHEPTPVGISISGLWLNEHHDEFEWLVQQEKLKKLDITWINHSYSHVYYHDLPFDENFMLFSHTNVDHEILGTEKLLIENGQVPSVFFRFPGLVSDKQLVLTLRHFGLIPVGTNAWLAHKQKAKPGSIILVHGNSNEHEGIELVMPMLDDEKNDWLPLDKAFD